MPRQSQLHLQLGQAAAYVLMASVFMAALLLLVGSEHFRTAALPGCGPAGCVESAEAPPLPDCALPGHGPCVDARDLPSCMQPGQEPCVFAQDVPDCMRPGRGPCPDTAPAQQPPILNLTEREGFRFATGSWAVSDDFMMKLRTVIAPALLRLGAEHQARVVEVVGHTDGVPMLLPQTPPERRPLQPQSPPDRRSPPQSLDRTLNPYLAGDRTLSGDKAVAVADNVGLGMMRAASVARALKEMPELQHQGFTFLALSAGQTIGPDDHPVGAENGQALGDEKRRRVEIRLRRSLREMDPGRTAARTGFDAAP